MIPLIQRIAHVSAWIAAVMVSLLPVLLGIDFGGVLCWSQLIMGYVVCIATLLAAAGTLVESKQGFMSRSSYLVPLGIWVAYAFFPLIEIPTSWVRVLSPASAAAYTDWLASLVENQVVPGKIPMSIIPDQTRHAAALFALLLPLTWMAGRVFSLQRRIVMLLAITSLGISLHALYAIAMTFFPDWLPSLSSEPTAGTGFGAFINRNNMALHLNLGIAAGLGICVGRLTDRIGVGIRSYTVDYVELAKDPVLIASVVSLVICLCGLIACGSRAGILSFLFALTLALVIRATTRSWIFPAVALIGIVTALIVISLGDSATSIERISEMNLRSGEGIADSGRWEHWGDACRTAIAFLPSGSGLGTYADAYLPFQATSNGAWFHHADNLWIELVVLQGVPGMCLAIWLIILLVRALRRLANSEVAIDRGLCTAGWFTLGAVILSQVFDFGLILPANLVCVSLLFSSVIVRSTIVSDKISSLQYGTLFSSRLEKAASSTRSDWRSITTACEFVCLASFGVIGFFVLPILKQDAAAEFISLASRATLQKSPLDRSEIEQRLTQLEHRLEVRPNAELFLIASDLQYQSARLADVDVDPAIDPDGFAIRYRETRRSVHRTKWRSGDLNDPIVTGVFGDYQRALDFNHQGLLRRPLSVDGRAQLIYLDFIHQDADLTRLALNQISQLRSRSPEQLLQLAFWAFNGSDIGMAEQFLKIATDIDPLQARAVVAFSQQYPGIRLVNSISDDTDALRIAAQQLMLDRTVEADSVLSEPNAEFLRHAVSRLDCKTSVTYDASSRCHELSAKILFLLGEPIEGADQFRAAIRIRPKDTSLRSNLITALRSAGMVDEAVLEAEQARDMFPQYAVYSEMIQDIDREKRMRNDPNLKPLNQ